MIPIPGICLTRYEYTDDQGRYNNPIIYEPAIGGTHRRQIPMLKGSGDLTGNFPLVIVPLVSLLARGPGNPVKIRDGRATVNDEGQSPKATVQ